MGADSGALADFVSTMGGDRALRVEESLGEGFVRLRVAEAERRQAKHDVRCVEDALIEMLRNARDAGARHIYVATARATCAPPRCLTTAPAFRMTCTTASSRRA